MYAPHDMSSGNFSNFQEMKINNLYSSINEYPNIYINICLFHYY